MPDTIQLRVGARASTPQWTRSSATWPTAPSRRPSIHLVKLRASQLNGCAYCLDMHWKDLRAAGESEQRLYSLDAWRECPFYSARERAALAWTEAVTQVSDGHVPDAVYDEARAHFDAKALADLTLAVATISAWNRLSIAARIRPGTYQPRPEPERSELDAHAAVDHPAVERRPGVDGPAAVGAR